MVQKFYSDICEKTTKQKRDLPRHIKCVHLKLRPFQCVLCYKTYKEKSKLNSHTASVHMGQEGQEKYCCDICEKTSDRKYRLTNHIMTVHFGIRPFHCTLCSASFPFQDRLQGHLETHDKTLAKGSFYCDICGKTFHRKYHFTKHIMAVHFGIRPFHCTLCSASFPFKDRLQGHLETHDKTLAKGSFYCDICGKTFHRKYHFTKHMMGVHFGICPFHCTLCSASFQSKDRLQMHSETHKETPRKFNFYCDICENGIRRKCHLAAHIMAVHYDFREFHCTLCSARFAFKDKLTRHLLTHENNRPSHFSENLAAKLQKHENTHKNISGKTTLTCDICQKTFGRKKHLIRHVNSVHYRLKPHLCAVCSKKFSNKDGLKRHTLQSHEMLVKKLYFCRICKYNSERKSDLLQHLLSHS